MANASASVNNGPPPAIIKYSTAGDVGRVIPQEKTTAQYCSGMPSWANRWPIIKHEPDYLSLDSSSDSETCCESESTCNCKNCNRSDSGSKTSSSGCCSCSYSYESREVIKDRQRSQARGTSERRHKGSKRMEKSSHRRGKHHLDLEMSSMSSFPTSATSSSTCCKYCQTSRKKHSDRCSVCRRPVDNIREATLVASSHPNKSSSRHTNERQRRKPSQHYHRCKTPRPQSMSRKSVNMLPMTKAMYLGVNTEIHPGPYGTDPKPDLLLYPIS